MPQNPTRVNGVKRATIARRLVSDLNDVQEVSDVYVAEHNNELVRLEVSRSNLTADVMRVLADHGANIGGICLETDASLQEAYVHPPRPE